MTKILPPDEPGVTRLTDREMTVLALSAEGESNKSIARKLGLIDVTVKAHRQSMMRKIGAKNITHAVAIAHKSGLL